MTTGEPLTPFRKIRGQLWPQSVVETNECKVCNFKNRRHYGCNYYLKLINKFKEYNFENKCCTFSVQGEALFSMAGIRICYAYFFLTVTIVATPIGKQSFTLK